MKRKVLMLLVFVGGAGLWLALAANAGGQEPPRDSRRGPGEMSPEEREKRIEEFRTRMSDQVRQQLGFSEQEWQLVRPRYDKVSDLNRQVSGGMRFGFGGPGFGGPGFGGPGRRPGEGGDRGGDRPAPTPRPEDQTEMGKARQKLSDVLAQEGASAEQIKAALTEYRAARTNLEQQLQEARKALREVLSVRQEAMLVARGVLD